MNSSPVSSNAEWQRRTLASVWHPCTQMQRAEVVPPLPMLALSLAFEGPDQIAASLATIFAAEIR